MRVKNNESRFGILELDSREMSKKIRSTNKRVHESVQEVLDFCTDKISSLTSETEAKVKKLEDELRN